MTAGWLGVAPKTVSAPFFAAIVLGCSWWTADLLHGRAALFARRLPTFGAVGTVLLLLPGVEFGQREHLLVAAALPYLALFARALQGEQEPRKTAMLVGVLAGLGCALKPSYALAFGLLELVGWARGARPLRIASVSALATVVGYGITPPGSFDQCLRPPGGYVRYCASGRACGTSAPGLGRRPRPDHSLGVLYVSARGDVFRRP